MRKYKMMNEYKIHDKIDAVYEIRKAMNESQQEIYLLIGVLEEDIFIIKEYAKWMHNSTNLFYKILEISKTGKTCLVLNTHPTEFQRQLAGNETDVSVFAPIYQAWSDVYKNQPIFFGIIGKETISIKAYNDKQSYAIIYHSCYEIDDNPKYEVEFLLDENKDDKNAEEGCFRFVNSKKEVRLPLAKWNALKQWKEQRERKELPQLHDIAYKSLIMAYYKEIHE